MYKTRIIMRRRTMINCSRCCMGNIGSSKSLEQSVKNHENECETAENYWAGVISTKTTLLLVIGIRTRASSGVIKPYSSGWQQAKVLISSFCS